MIQSLRTRWIIILGVFAMAIVWNVPNFFDVKEWITEKKIVYGLDIQGGLHLVMGVDVDGVIVERTARLAENLKEELKEEAITVTSVMVTPENKKELQIKFTPSSDTSKEIVSYIDKNHGTTLQIVGQEEGMISIRYFDVYANLMKKQVVDQSIEVIRNRIDEFGVSEPVIAAQGENRILVQLPGIEDSARAKDLINRTARLQFMLVSEAKEAAEVEQWVSEAETAGNYALGKDGMGYSAYVKRVNEDLKGKLPENSRVVFQKAENAVSLEAGKITRLVEVSDVDGGHLEDAFVGYDQFNRPQVNFRLSVEGGRKFGKLTEENVNRQLAIVLDDVLKSAPSIQSKITTAGVINLGQSDYQKTLEEAEFIATTLRAGALPATLEQLEERTVGPTLGADSIKKGEVAGLVGALLVLGFMLFYYRNLGFGADIMLNMVQVMNILLILAILTSLGATLTLPGVAGIVLTLGMAVDANVIIYERIKEELSKGSTMTAAVKDGFGHAFSAIFDANITTAAVCIVLMYFGSGPVRGFAVTLIIGIVTSMFTAIFVSRTIFDTQFRKQPKHKMA